MQGFRQAPGFSQVKVSFGKLVSFFIVRLFFGLFLLFMEALGWE
jgi:hypothetical protein